MSKFRGKYLLRIRNNYFEVLKEAYPDFDWEPWKFEHSPKNIWQDPKNVRKYMEWAAPQLNIKNKEDWYNVEITVCENKQEFSLKFQGFLSNSWKIFNVSEKLVYGSINRGFS